jgi:hypothetical protein
VLDSLSVIIWVPLYDFLIAPYFARRGRPISGLVRIGIGFVIAILSMIAAAGELRNSTWLVARSQQGTSVLKLCCQG